MKISIIACCIALLFCFNSFLYRLFVFYKTLYFVLSDMNDLFAKHRHSTELRKTVAYGRNRKAAEAALTFVTKKQTNQNTKKHKY